MKQEIKNKIELIKQGQIPEGYEKTSFGVFPVDWEKKKRLKSLGPFSKGKGLPGTALINEGVPCVGYGDIYMKYNIHFDKTKSFVDKDTANESQAINKGTLLFTGTGETALEIGKCVCYNGNETIYAGGDILLFNSNNVNPLFLAYQQNIEFAIKQKAKFGQGHSVVHIQRDNLEKLNLAYPKSQTEQSKIAEILMKWDEAIEAQEQFITKLEIRKKALMQKLLTPKEGWIKVKIKDLIISVRKNEKVSNRYLEINNVDINTGTYILEDKKPVVGARKAYSNTLLISTVRPYRGAITVLKENIYVSSAFAQLNFDNLYTLQCVSFIVKNRKFLFRMLSLCTGSTYPTVSYKDIISQKIYLPNNYEEQKRIANILSSADKEIDLHKQKLEKLKEQRKSLMQLLLTGIVRTIDNGQLTMDR